MEGSSCGLRKCLTRQDCFTCDVPAISPSLLPLWASSRRIHPSGSTASIPSVPLVSEDFSSFHQTIKIFSFGLALIASQGVRAVGTRVGKGSRTPRTQRVLPLATQHNTTGHFLEGHKRRRYSLQYELLRDKAEEPTGVTFCRLSRTFKRHECL